MKLPIILAAFALLIIIPLASQNSFAQVNSGGFQAGGVNIDGSWYVGEGLKVGDYFSFNVCHVDYLDCSDFDMAIPTGHVSKWQTRIITQPITTRGAVANPNSSAPNSAAIITSLPVFNWPSH